MNREDRCESIFNDDRDRLLFLDTLNEACEKTDWQIHAWCLMNNDFHLVTETPRGNLVEGRQWLLGVYTNRFNHRQKEFGHLFSGHSGPEIQESAMAKAERIVQEELKSLSWDAQALRGRRKGDPRKLQIAARLRRETTMSLEWIANRLCMVPPTYVAHLLQRKMTGRQLVKKLCSDPASDALTPPGAPWKSIASE